MKEYIQYTSTICCLSTERSIKFTSPGIVLIVQMPVFHSITSEVLETPESEEEFVALITDEDHNVAFRIESSLGLALLLLHMSGRNRTENGANADPELMTQLQNSLGAFSNLLFGNQARDNNNTTGAERTDDNGQGGEPSIDTATDPSEPLFSPAITEMRDWITSLLAARQGTEQ